MKRNLTTVFLAMAWIGTWSAARIGAVEPWSPVNINFNLNATNVAPPTSPPAQGVTTTNLTTLVNGVVSNTLVTNSILVQARLGDLVHGLNDQPVVMSHLDGTNANAGTSYLTIYLSSSMAAGTLPTNGLFRVQWDYVNDQSAYWGADLSLRRGVAGGYHSLFQLQDANSGKDLTISGASGSTNFANVLKPDFATHFDVLLNLDSKIFTVNFSNNLGSASWSDTFQNTNQTTEVGYFIGNISTVRQGVFGFDNFVFAAVPEPSAAMAIGSGLAFLAFLRRRQ